MKNTLLILCITLLYAVSSLAQEYRVVVPVAKNPQNGEWSVLLGLYKDNQWWPFRAEVQEGEDSQIAAERALSSGTNNVYSIKIYNVPWKQMGKTFIHFVPVKFISGSTLYDTARNARVTDFVWVPASTLLQKGPIKPHTNKNAQVGESFLRDFKVWPEIETKLSTLQQSGPATVPAPGTKTQPGTTTKISGSTGTQWGGNSNAIYFYNDNEPYYEFTNFWPQDITIDGKLWPTNEQYYQAMKFNDGKLQETIRQFKTDSSGSGPRKAFDFAKQHAADVRSDWQKISLDIMRKAIHAKFTQHADLSKLLLATGNKMLVEDAGAKDAFYGAGADYNGQNWLGRILMELRNSFYAKKTSQLQPQVQPQSEKQPVSLAVELQNLAQVLRHLESVLEDEL